MAISTNQKPTIYRNLYENTGPGPSKLYTLTRFRFKVGPATQTLQQHWNSIGWIDHPVVWFQCWCSAGQTYLTLAQHWTSTGWIFRISGIFSCRATSRAVHHHQKLYTEDFQNVFTQASAPTVREVLGCGLVDSNVPWEWLYFCVFRLIFIKTTSKTGIIT